MRIDRNAAAIVGHGQESVGAEFHLDEGGVASERLVHRVVDHFGEQMMQRLFVGAADIHAGPAADRLKPLEHLDVGRGVAGFGAAGAGGNLQRSSALGFIGPEQIIVGFCFGRFFQWLGHGSSCDARVIAQANRLL